MAKYLSENGLIYLWGKFRALLAGKVNVEEGMGLSQNSYTNEEKTKLAGLENYTLPNASTETLGGIKAGTGLTITDGVASVDNPTWENVQGKPDVALKSDITNVYRYKGSVTSESNLPTEDLTAGDVYNAEDNGMNYAWTGSDWDPLGMSIEIAPITNDEIDAIMNNNGE